MKLTLINTLLKLLFYRSPRFIISKEEEHLFDQVFENGCKSPEKLISYNLSIPKYKFLHHLSKNKSIVLHGSNNKQIQTFEPRDQTLFNGKMDKAVFATKDPIWACFYAVLKKECIEGNIRNGSMTVNGKDKFHIYSLTEQTLTKVPWTSGSIYLLPEKLFTHISEGTIQFDEWISRETVQPVAKLEVEPTDFYFQNKVGKHEANESLAKTWFFYKLKTLRN